MTTSTMPQTRNKKVLGFQFLQDGKGAAHSVILDSSITIRRRAEKLNHLELLKLRSHKEFMDRNVRILEERQKRIKEKMEKGLEVRNAYHHLVNEEFKVDNFDTLTWGYKVKEAKKDPQRLKRFVYETRIYHSGFSVSNLQKEVNAKVENLKPERKRQQAKAKMIERQIKDSKIDLFDRKRSLTMILDDRKQNTRDIGRHKPVLPPIGGKTEKSLFDLLQEENNREDTSAYMSSK